MNKLFYPKLAASNIKKNGKTYLPYTLTCIFTIAIFYIMKSLSLNEGLEKMVGADTISYTMKLGCSVAGIFSVIFLFYTNSFLMKRRKKEFGLFNILGMEKKHISKVIGFETLYIAVISLILGLALGILLDKVMYLVILNMLGYGITLGFYISGNAILTTVILFGSIFLLILLNSVRQIHLAKPIELLQSTNTGEREPKTKWLMAIIGVICIVTGYYLSVSIENPVLALSTFFVAVILVIVGTYFLFIAGSIALLKMLRKNKKYYYKTRHFTSISGMIYRMKQNAVGLANICILSTMVLVMISSTASLMIGIDDIVKTRYPYDFTIYSDEEWSSDKNAEVKVLAEQKIKDGGLKIKEEMVYTYLSFAAVEDGDTYITDQGVEQVISFENVNNLFFVPLSDYNRITGENNVLKPEEILMYSNRDEFEYDTLSVFDRKYKITEKLDHFWPNGILSSFISTTRFIVVNDMAEVEYLYAAQRTAYGDNGSNIQTCYDFNMTGDKDAKIAVYDSFFDALHEKEYAVSAECGAAEIDSALAVYGGLFFLGIFLGALFIMATVLIIYYKQISEGYDDKERYNIMKKVGMSRSDIKSTIHSQIITVFFLPLVTAGIHVVFAFPLISKILAVLNLTNTSLFIICTIVCFLVFGALYAAIYALTAKAYYKIVSM